MLITALTELAVGLKIFDPVLLRRGSQNVSKSNSRCCACVVFLSSTITKIQYPGVETVDL